MTTQTRPHSPVTAGFKASAEMTRNPPAARGNYRRKPMATNPGCETDLTPHRTLVYQWLQAGMSYGDASLYVQGLQESGALEQRALDVYRKMKGDS